MTRPLQPPAPAFLFFGIFGCDRDAVENAGSALQSRYGPWHASGESDYFEFPDTETYRESMGPRLVRKFFVSATRLPQDGLAAVKRWTIDVEAHIAARWRERTGVERPVNIDPGLVNDCRVILATTKDYAHRLYRGDGIWEEVTLVWQKGAFRAMPWTYRDFRAPTYHAFLARFREEFLGRNPS